MLSTLKGSSVAHILLRSQKIGRENPGYDFQKLVDINIVGDQRRGKPNP
jgi:hypothetical protein